MPINNKITAVTIATDNSVTGTSEEQSLTDDIGTGVFAVAKVFSDDQTTYYSEKTLGRTAAMNLAVGFVLGDMRGVKAANRGEGTLLNSFRAA